jgi:hypothetical protein
MSLGIFSILVLLICFNDITPCQINGEIQGFCANKKEIVSQLPFCGEYVSDYICVPYFSVIYFEKLIVGNMA